MGSDSDRYIVVGSKDSPTLAGMDTTTYVQVPAKVFEDLLAEVRLTRKFIEELSNPKEYYTHEEVMAFFNKSDQTIRRWRDEGTLGFSEINKNTYIYYKRDVDRLIERNYHKPFALKRAV